ncbi:hypothetical protein [Nioella aestuarii]|uniref:hypothetical protein n=1 Tax=Nioella aestuarii TaxID=1662864 RepID=UPI003D7FCEE2
MRLAPLISLCLLATPAMAETGYSCAFTVACEAAGSCAPAEIQTEIGTGEDGVMAFLEADAAPLPALTLSDEDSMPFTIATTAPGAESDLITIHADGTALRSRHPADPGSPATTYFGICEET